MTEHIGNNKQIAKNTLILYIRMTLIMLITLYISRAILNILGVEDFGIYNVIAGFVSMFAFLSSTIAGGASRFFAFEIGRNDTEKLHQYFKISVLSFGILSLVILLFAETLGLWFIKNKLVIPSERLHAGLIVYHFSVLGFIANMFSTPYKSMVIAHERMNFYAYISIVEVTLNLGIILLLKYISIDKLELYGISLFGLNILITFLFYLYCRKRYTEARFSFFWDKQMFQDFFEYSLWIIIGGLSGVLRGQGLNILLNVFFGPAVNAARGIAYQVYSAINQFVNNFYTACRPQITKRYAAGEHEKMMTLIFSSSRICYLLTLFFTIPIFIETPIILKIWLNIVPNYTLIFTRLVLITILIETISYPFQAAVSATGRVKWYQIITGGITISTLPIAYYFLKSKYSPEAVFYVSIIMAFVAQISRLIFMKVLLKMSILSFMKNVVFRLIIVSILSVIVPILIYHCTSYSVSRFIYIILTSFTAVAVFGFLFGIAKNERQSIIIKIKSKIYGKTVS